MAGRQEGGRERREGRREGGMVLCKVSYPYKYYSAEVAPLKNYLSKIFKKVLNNSVHEVDVYTLSPLQFEVLGSLVLLQQIALEKKLDLAPGQPGLVQVALH